MASVFYDEDTKRWKFEIDRLVKKDDGTTERIRKRKVFPKGTTEAQANILSSKLESSLYVRVQIFENEKGWAKYVEDLYKSKSSWLYTSLQKARNRALNAEKPCTLTPEEIKDLLLDCGGRCSITGVRFDITEPLAGKKRPYYHSLDRISCAGGYTKDNTRIVCYATNVAMMDWGEAVFADLAIGYAIRKYSLGKMLLS